MTSEQRLRAGEGAPTCLEIKMLYPRLFFCKEESRNEVVAGGESEVGGCFAFSGGAITAHC